MFRRSSLAGLSRIASKRSLLGCAFPRRCLAAAADSFLGGSNSIYVDEMYRAWKKDPSSVHVSWDIYFRTGSFAAPPTLDSSVIPILANAPSSAEHSAHGSSAHSDSKIVRVTQMIRAYQVRGHLLANLDPLGLVRHGVDHKLISPDALDLRTFGLSESDLELSFDVQAPNILGFQEHGRGQQKLNKLVDRLNQTYKGTIGIEYMHISDTEQCNFLRQRLETPEPFSFTPSEKLRILDRLTWADHFEHFLAFKYPTAKRFGLEGAEALIPGMKELVDTAADLGVSDIVMGMPHRGRLNLLTTVIKKPLEQIFCEFSGGGDTSEWEGSGDVKYHLGMSHDREVYGGKTIHLTLVANPSHLEAVNPVVTGKCRAKQFFNGDKDRSKTMAVLLHGDAAFAGQGIVYETMGFTALPDYTVGGTIHIVVNNQIGFTTDPMESRSSAYCTDIAKAFGAPIFHVNGDDIEAVVRVCKIAAEWRQKFHKDVVIDIVCYRKYGHNEIDEPKFTQPLMYDTISKKSSPLKVYSQKLLNEGTVSSKDASDISQRINSNLNNSFEKAKDYCYKPSDWLSSKWTGLKSSHHHSHIRDTGVPEETLRQIGQKLVSLPEDFTIHNRLKMIMNNKEKMVTSGQDIDWGTAEALAFGSLLLEGTHVRLSGQDVERGTFSHRHAVLHDQVSKEKNIHIPLANLDPKQAIFTVSNSSLSEFGVLGFELGYTLESPHQLVCWEAQFGDFVNGAQIIIDQFISSGEAKWMRQSGLVMLLPHGYEGQGPEHSSCRIERFLQSSNEDEDVFPDMRQSVRSQIQKSNWQIVNCSTPANYFHVLRRQTHRDFRKPLVIATPKSLLRHKMATSSYADMAEGTRFMRVIGEDCEKWGINPSEVKKLVFCTGKVYYDLLQHRISNDIKNVALVRIEQLSPFPFDKVLEEANRFPNAEIAWCQEEPKNMGAWFYTKPRIQTALRKLNKDTSVSYSGRVPSASPATGYGKMHKIEQDSLVEDAFKVRH